jgi:hypothetical protein
VYNITYEVLEYRDLCLLGYCVTGGNSRDVAGVVTDGLYMS